MPATPPPDTQSLDLPPSQPQASVRNGALIPDLDTIRSILFTLQQKMKTDTRLAAAFQANPTKILGEVGLCLDVQVEVMKLLGIPIPEGGCGNTECFNTPLPPP
jgi:hypothetical protein